MPKLVVCADDYAISASVCDAINELAKQNRISATSVMTLSDLWPHQSVNLKPFKGAIDVGLHLDWTSDFAVHHGHGKKLNRLMLESVLTQQTSSKLKNIIHFQLDLFEKYWGEVPNFIDGHQHIHQFNGIREALIDVIKERYIRSNLATKVPYLRVSQTIKAQNSMKSKIIAFMGAKKLIQMAKHEGIPFMTYLTGIYDLKVGSITYSDRMKKWLEQLPTETACILMCHPSTHFEANDLISEARVQEYQYLKSEDFLVDLNQYNTHIAIASQT